MSCKRFAHHVASDIPVENGLYGRFHFWLHWLICPFCRRYWAEIKALGRLQRQNAALENHPAVRIVDVKNRIKARLREKK